MHVQAFLVEDSVEMRATLVEAMEEITPVKFVGYAETETAARRWLGANNRHWDLAIVDLFLGDGSGFGVLQDCKDRRPGQKVVVLTSYRNQDINNRCLELGADKVFDKSQDVERLVNYCRAHAEHLNSAFQPLS